MRAPFRPSSAKVAPRSEGDAAAYQIHALKATNRFKILSRPVVFTSNNKRAKITSGQKIPGPASTISPLDNGGGLVSEPMKMDY